jgi:hypothetical protein
MIIAVDGAEDPDLYALQRQERAANGYADGSDGYAPEGVEG